MIQLFIGMGVGYLAGVLTMGLLCAYLERRHGEGRVHFWPTRKAYEDWAVRGRSAE